MGPSGRGPGGNCSSAALLNSPLEIYFKYDFVHRCLTKEVKCNLNLPFIAYKSRKAQKEAK